MRPLFHDTTLEARFWDRGHVVVDLLDRETVRALARIFDRFAGHHHDGISPTILSRDHGYRAQAHAEVAPLLERALAVYLDRFGLCHAGFVTKSPDSPASGMDLHQDFSWVDERRHQGLTVWCPLVGTDERNGWLGVVGGSHRVGPHARAATAFPWPHLEEQIHERHVTHLPLRAGQAVLMHPAAFHTSPPNTTAEPRVVAAGMAAPREAALEYCHRDAGGDTTWVDVYEVDADFYQRHVLGTRPARPLARSVRHATPELSARDLEGLRLATRC